MLLSVMKDCAVHIVPNKLEPMEDNQRGDTIVIMQASQAIQLTLCLLHGAAVPKQ